MILEVIFRFLLDGCKHAADGINRAVDVVIDAADQTDEDDTQHIVNHRRHTHHVDGNDAEHDITGLGNRLESLESQSHIRIVVKTKKRLCHNSLLFFNRPNGREIKQNY